MTYYQFLTPKCCNYSRIANSVEIAASRLNMLQIARELMRHWGGKIPGKGEKNHCRKPGPLLFDRLNETQSKMLVDRTGYWYGLIMFDMYVYIGDLHFDNVCTPSSLQSMTARSRAQMEVLRSQVQRRRRLEGFADLLQLCRRMDWILCHCQSLHELRRWGIWKDGQMGNCRKELVWSQMRRTPINSKQVKLTPVQRLFRLQQ